MSEHAKERRQMSEIRRDDIYQEVVAHLNEPVLLCFDVVRLIGYGETNVDCYYIVTSHQRGEYWASAVGGFIPLDRLKGQGYVRSNAGEDWDDYRRIDNWLSLNNCPKVAAIKIDLRHDDNEGHQP